MFLLFRAGVLAPAARRPLPANGIGDLGPVAEHAHAAARRHRFWPAPVAKGGGCTRHAPGGGRVDETGAPPPPPPVAPARLRGPHKEARKGAVIVCE